MGNTNFSICGNKNAKQAPSSTKDASARLLMKEKMVQNVVLIWLDSSIDNDSTNCQNTISQLRRSVNVVNTFTNSDQCVQFIHTIRNNKACMIISGSLGQHIVPRVHSMRQVDSIFILCDKKKRHEEWVKEWSKIKGVFTKIKPICEELKQASQQCEQNAISITFVVTSDDAINNISINLLIIVVMYSTAINKN
jgi:hypothetical protein